MPNEKIKVAVNGYGVIGKRVADAVSLQDDMELVGISDIASDYRILGAKRRGYNIFASLEEKIPEMRKAGVEVKGAIEDLLKTVDAVVDATPKGIGAKNKSLYDKMGVKSIFQGGEKHELTGFSFVAQANFEQARGRDSLRCVSCNTTGICRVIGALEKLGLVKKARVSIFRRGTDPWESHKNGLLNTVVPEGKVPSHQGPDAKTVIPDLPIVTIAAAGSFNLSHLHSAFIELKKEMPRQEVIALFKNTPRVSFVRKDLGVEGLNSVIEIMRDLARPRNDMWEVVLWEDVITAEQNEIYLVYQVHNEAVVIPENIDAIRAIMDTKLTAEESIKKTNESLGVSEKIL